MNDEYIKKLEATNKALEDENLRLEKSIEAYSSLRNHLLMALLTCRSLIFDFVVKDSPKRNEKTDRELDSLLKQLKRETSSISFDKPIDPFSHPGYDKARAFIEEIEKSPLDKNKKSV
jgi:hypothetical protein